MNKAFGKETLTSNITELPLMSVERLLTETASQSEGKIN